jgi:hypothetical protein
MPLFDGGRMLHTCFILAMTVWLVAPSLPSRIFAAGHATKPNPEHVLSGIDVSGTIQQVIAKYGSPDRVVNVDVAHAPERSGERHYLWTKGNTKLSVTTQHYINNDGKEIESETFAIEVTGDAPVGDIGKTGAGLSLGDTLERANQVYGAHFHKSQIYKTHFHGEYFPVQALEWGEDSASWTRLCLALDKQGRINFILLAMVKD